MSGPHGESCSTCTWHDALVGAAGLCRRSNAHVILNSQSSLVSMWPTTLPTDWCALFVAKGS